MKTWHIENAVVSAVLIIVWACTGQRAIELVGCAAVFCGFCHASIAERMREREAAREAQTDKEKDRAKRFAASLAALVA